MLYNFDVTLFVTLFWTCDCQNITFLHFIIFLYKIMIGDGLYFFLCYIVLYKVRYILGTV